MTSSTDDITLFKDPEIKTLIQKHKNENVSDVIIRLSYLSFEKRNFIARQIKGHQKARDKFPFLSEFEDIIFPQGISVEQSSSELTAQFKSNLFSGNKAVDLTSGFGIDSIFLSKNFQHITLIDINDQLLTTVEHNFKCIGITNTHYQNCSAEEAIKNISNEVDLIYIDPSRRVKNQKKFRIVDCEPNILELISTMCAKSKNIMIKLSPMSDIKDILNKIPELTAIHVVGVDNECKEILVLFEEGKEFNGMIQCAELGKKQFKYSVDLEAESSIGVIPGAVNKYVYIPNSVINKAGAFKSITKDFKVAKISGNTHLYTSGKLIQTFPGRVYETIGVSSYSKNALSELTNETNFNIIKRNFRDDIKTISKKLKIGVSGEYYLLAYRNHKEKPEIAVCKRIIA